MVDNTDPLADLDLKHAIDLRWTLRDIRGKRWKSRPLIKANSKR
jgi:hypothetical protein